MTEEETHSEQRTNREISNANLIHIKPGETLNPGGRPKDPGITKSQIAMLDKPCKYDKSMTWREYLALKGLEQAVVRDRALEYLKERLEGKVPDTHKIEADIPISLVFKEIERGDATEQEEG